MVFRNKALKTTAAAIAIISMVGAGTINYVHADSTLANQGVAIERTINNNKIEYDVIYVNPDGVKEPNNQQGTMESMMVLDGTTYEIEVENGEYYVTVKFKSDMAALMEDYRFKVDGKDAKYTVEGSSYRIKLDKVDSEIEATMYVDAMGRDVSFALVPKGEITTEKKIKDGTYTVTNDVQYIFIEGTDLGKHESVEAFVEVYQAATRRTVQEKTTLKVENGKLNTIVSFGSSYTALSDIKFAAGEQELDVQTGVPVMVEDREGNISEKNYGVQFELPSLDSELTAAFTTSYNGKVYNYTFKLDDISSVQYDETITQIIPEEDESDNNESNNGSDNNGSNGNLNNGSSNNGSNNNGSNNNGSGSETEDEKITMEIGKEYKSEFNITGTSETGMNMITRYLDPQAKIVKVSENNYDVTLTFTDSEGKLNVSDLIKNYTIYVNGTKVNCEVISNVSRSVDSVSIKFRISDLNDSIKVGLYVAPMGRDIEFGLDLLATDEQDLVNGTGSGTTTGNQSGTTTETLPQTGAAIDANMIMGAGAIMMSAGILGRRKRK